MRLGGASALPFSKQTPACLEKGVEMGIFVVMALCGAVWLIFTA
jgi:hypothetical protein